MLQRPLKDKYIHVLPEKKLVDNTYSEVYTGNAVHDDKDISIRQLLEAEV